MRPGCTPVPRLCAGGDLQKRLEGFTDQFLPEPTAAPLGRRFADDSSRVYVLGSGCSEMTMTMFLVSIMK